MSEFNQVEVCSLSEILERLAEFTGNNTDASLARALGISPQAIANARKKKSIPFERLAKFAMSEGISLDWLFTGKSGHDKEIDPTLFSEIRERIKQSDIKNRMTPATEQMLHIVVTIYNSVIACKTAERRDYVFDTQIALLNTALYQEAKTLLDGNNLIPEVRAELNEFVGTQEQLVSLLRKGLSALGYTAVEDNVPSVSQVKEASTANQNFHGSVKQAAGRDINNKENK